MVFRSTHFNEILPQFIVNQRWNKTQIAWIKETLEETSEIDCEWRTHFITRCAELHEVGQFTSQALFNAYQNSQLESRKK